MFWSALLLLLVQPVLTKAILPWFGGSAGVWTTSMLFYQTVLLLGLCLRASDCAQAFAGMQGAIAHRASPDQLALLPCIPPRLEAEPPAMIRQRGFSDCCSATVGLPYFLLASTSPLVQSWFARTQTDVTLPAVRPIECRFLISLLLIRWSSSRAYPPATR